uniref:COP9 signalosome complex subunit 1B, putative n=1 Tax=Entamoeba invadens TaxID=33085 RepID=S0AZY8_ENTIV|nr:COP9 signalosome complex subunit 1B, putative [Entamoeba invadens]
MDKYIEGYSSYGRMLRYYNILSTEAASPEKITAAIEYTQRLNNIGAFAKLKEVLSSQLALDEPQWKKETASKLFDTVKELEGRISAVYVDDEKAELLFELSDIHESHGEYAKAVKNCLGAIENIKNSTLLAKGYYRLIRLNIFLENFHQANTFLEKLKSLNDSVKAFYTAFINFMSFFMAIRSTENFVNAFNLLDSVTTFEEKDKWQFSEFLSFEDVAIFGTLIGLLTQKHKVNVENLVNNSKFRNQANTVPELVVLLEDYKQNKFANICNDVRQLEKCMKYNLYFGQNIGSVIATVRSKCYIEYIFAYSVVDMNLMAKMFGDSLITVENSLEEFINAGTIKAKIDSITHTLIFVQGDERYNAYNAAVEAVTKAIQLSQEIVLKSDAMLDFI